VGSVLHDYQLMNLLDHYAGQKGAQVKGIPASRITTKSLDSRSTWRTRRPTRSRAPARTARTTSCSRTATRTCPARRCASSTSSATPACRAVSGADDGTVTIPPNTDSTTAGAKVDNWYVSLVGLDPKNNRILVKSFDKAFDASMDAKELKAFASYPQIIAVVAHDDNDDVNSGAESYAGYTLTINGKGRDGRRKVARRLAH